jgi:hypothetical protein
MLEGKITGVIGENHLARLGVGDGAKCCGVKTLPERRNLDAVIDKKALGRAHGSGACLSREPGDGGIGGGKTGEKEALEARIKAVVVEGELGLREPSKEVGPKKGGVVRRGRGRWSGSGRAGSGGASGHGPKHAPRRDAGNQGSQEGREKR